MRQIVDDFIKRQTILQQLHDENSHKKREDIYWRVID